MYAFLILATVYVEAYGILLSRNPDWAIPLIGHWEVIGFGQDLIGVLCLVGLATFTVIRLKNDPAKIGRKSRFKGSHLGGAWLTLFMIFNVIWTMFLFRGAASAADNLPYDQGAFASIGLGKIFDGLGHDSSRAARARRPAAPHRRHAGVPHRSCCTPSTCTSSSRRSTSCSSVPTRRPAETTRARSRWVR